MVSGKLCIGLKQVTNNDKLYVVTSIFNPQEYQSRYRLYNNFADYIKQFENVELWTVELIFEGQNFVVTQSDCPQHIQLKTDEILWYKENLLNIGIQHLPVEAKYIAWIDADIVFENPNWSADTIAALDQYPFVQMFEEALDLGPDGEVVGRDKSFIYKWLNGNENPKKRGRSGLAWAATRDALDCVGGLIDWGIVGSGDWFMAFSLTQQVTDSSLNRKSGGFSGQAIQAWADLCKKCVAGNVGYVTGSIKHNWHGKKSNRGYNWRWKILSENKFNPIEDLGYKENGLIKLKSHKPQLLEDIQQYFQSRDEDDTEK